MAEPKNQATQYESPNDGSRNAGSSDSYESPSPLLLLLKIQTSRKTRSLGHLLLLLKTQSSITS
jgi:hypothetical protein